MSFHAFGHELYEGLGTFFFKFVVFMDDLCEELGLEEVLPGPPRHVELPHSTCPTTPFPKLKIGVHPRDTRHVECPSASQTHFAKTGISWARKLEIAHRLLRWNPDSKGYLLI